jgi:hypothetical protein
VTGSTRNSSSSTPTENGFPEPKASPIPSSLDRPVAFPDHETAKPRPKLLLHFRPNRRRRGEHARDELEGLSRDELYERAQQAIVPGRASMTKDELVKALSE